MKLFCVRIAISFLTFFLKNITVRTFFPSSTLIVEKFASIYSKEPASSSFLIPFFFSPNDGHHHLVVDYRMLHLLEEFTVLISEVFSLV